MSTEDIKNQFVFILTNIVDLSEKCGKINSKDIDSIITNAISSNKKHMILKKLYELEDNTCKLRMAIVKANLVSSTGSGNNDPEPVNEEIDEEDSKNIKKDKKDVKDEKDKKVSEVKEKEEEVKEQTEKKIKEKKQQEIKDKNDKEEKKEVKEKTEIKTKGKKQQEIKDKNDMEEKKEIKEIKKVKEVKDKKKKEETDKEKKGSLKSVANSKPIPQLDSESDSDDSESKSENKEDKLHIKRKKIPKQIKIHVWNEYIGSGIPMSKCLCCKKEIINNNNFHCGHVIADSKGGDLTIKNLRPICAPCNLAMGTMSMNEFTKTYFGWEV